MEWFKKYQYPIISGLLGVILACFILFFGFFKTLFVLILGALGAGIGYYIQNKKIIKYWMPPANYVQLIKKLGVKW